MNELSDILFIDWIPSRISWLPFLFMSVSASEMTRVVEITFFLKWSVWTRYRFVSHVEENRRRTWSERTNRTRLKRVDRNVFVRLERVRHFIRHAFCNRVRCRCERSFLRIRRHYTTINHILLITLYCRIIRLYYNISFDYTDTRSSCDNVKIIITDLQSITKTKEKRNSTTKRWFHKILT